jgi:hypothetical protein
MTANGEAFTRFAVPLLASLRLSSIRSAPGVSDRPVAAIDDRQLYGNIIEIVRLKESVPINGIRNQIRQLARIVAGIRASANNWEVAIVA